MIVKRTSETLVNGKGNQFIFIDGEAGTGKTVLNSSTFYVLFSEAENRNKKLKCYLLVNHDEQVTVYQQIALKHGIQNKKDEVVCKPTHFINYHSENDPVDVVFIDEAHLLLTQGKQSYREKIN